MSDRALKRIFLILGLLVLVYGAVALLDRVGGDGAPGDEALASTLASLEPESADAVVFEDPTEAAGRRRLERTGPATWSVEGHPADSSHAARLMAALAGARAGGVVSINPANHARMGVDDASAIRMIVERGGEADTLLLGESGPGFGSVYVRLPGGDAVHVVEADLRAAATRTADAWRSRRLAAVDTSAVRSVEVSAAGAGFVLEREDGFWTVGGMPADSATVQALMGELAALEGTDIAGGGVPEREADRVVTVRGESGVALTVRLWEPAEDGGSALTAVAEGPDAVQPGTAFGLSSWKAGRLTPGVEEVVKQEESEEGAAG